MVLLTSRGVTGLYKHFIGFLEDRKLCSGSGWHSPISVPCSAAQAFLGPIRGQWTCAEAQVSPGLPPCASAFDNNDPGSWAIVENLRILSQSVTYFSAFPGWQEQCQDPLEELDLGWLWRMKEACWVFQASARQCWSWEGTCSHPRGSANLGMSSTESPTNRVHQ